MKKSSVREGRWQAFYLSCQAFLGVCIFLLIPFIDVVRRSFTGAVSGAFVGLDNYINIFQTPAFLLAGKNTLRFTAVCIPILLFLSLFIAVFSTETEAVWQAIKKHIFDSNGHTGCKCGTALAAIIPRKRNIERHSGGLGVSGQNWMNTDYAFRDLGVQLCVEKSGIRYSAMGGRAFKHIPGHLRGSQSGWGRRMEMFYKDYHAESAALPLYH